MNSPPRSLAFFLLALALIAPYMLGPVRPSAPAELARWYAKNGFRPWGWQSDWGGGSPAWMAGAPGPAMLAATLAATGVSQERATRIVEGLFYAAGAVALFYLSQALGLPGPWTPLALALAPHRWSDLARQGNTGHAIAIALIAGFLSGILLARISRHVAGKRPQVPRKHRGGPALQTVGVCLALPLLTFLLLPRAGEVDVWSLWSEIEIGVALLAGWIAKRVRRILPIAACAAVFAAGLCWQMLLPQPALVELQSLFWLARHAPGEIALGPPAPRPGLNGICSQAEKLVAAREEGAVLWLRALGASHLVSSRAARYDALLETEHHDGAGYQIYQVPLHRPATAVLVSRRQWRTLPRLRSLYDRASLAAYVNWADRPDAAGFRWLSPRTADIRAYFGPDDIILIRQTAVPGWMATVNGQPLECLKDPLGFLLLDPARQGPLTVLLRAPLLTAPTAIPSLPTAILPAINPDGIVDAIRHTPSPFPPGAVITIYGTDLATGGSARVLASGRLAQVLYASPQQINARLPPDLPIGPAAIVVESVGLASNPESIEIHSAKADAPPSPIPQFLNSSIPQFRAGFYQWSGTPVQGDPADVLTQARRYATAAGAKVFRLYLGPRYDYLHHMGSPLAFSADGITGPLTPARILALPRYRAVLEDPAIETVILTTYSVADYGGGPDELNPLRYPTPAPGPAEQSQLRELCEFLYSNFAESPKTVIVANSEADDKMLGIMNYTGSPERAIESTIAWTRARHAAIEQAREAHPGARLRLLHGFEISLVNLGIARVGNEFRKRPDGEWNALRSVVPNIRFDLLLYSAYESINSPFDTRQTDLDPAQVGLRLRRDLDRIRDRSRASLSLTGKRLFGDRFVAIGEMGFPRERFEPLSTGGVLPRLMAALQSAAGWGSPYIILWQVFDNPRAGTEPYGFGMIDPQGQAPRLKPLPNGCDSIQACISTEPRP